MSYVKKVKKEGGEFFKAVEKVKRVLSERGEQRSRSLNSKK